VRRKNSIVAITWTNFLRGENITQATIQGNRTKKTTRIPHSGEEDDNMEDNDDRNAQIVDVVVLDEPPAEIIFDDNGDDSHCLIVTTQLLPTGAYRSINI
jgi:hypothetical protein